MAESVRGDVRCALGPALSRSFSGGGGSRWLWLPGFLASAFLRLPGFGLNPTNSNTRRKKQ